MVLDPTVKPLREEDIGKNPALSFDGEFYVVVWVENIEGAYSDPTVWSLPSASSCMLRLTRFRRSGEVIDPGGILVAKGVDCDTTSRIATGAGLSVVFWTHGMFSKAQARYARIRNRDATILDPDGIALRAQVVPSSDYYEGGTHQDVIFRNGRFLLLWRFEKRLMLAQLDPQRNVATPAIASTSDNADQARMAATPQGIAVVFATPTGACVARSRS